MFANSINSDDKNILVNAFNKNNYFFVEKDTNPFKNFLTDFIDSNYGLYELQIMYSMLYRTGRLTAAAKNATNYTKQSHSPFLDNKFLRNSLKVSRKENRNEEIHYQILSRIDKRLVDIPFAKDRWRIERKKPLHKNDYENWLKREPFYPDSVLGNYNWRQVHNNDKEIVDQFRNILLSNSNHLVYQIVDYSKVERIFDNKIIAKHMRFIWSLSSIIIFVNELTDISNNHFDKTIQIKLPSTNINNYKKKKKLIDISNEFYAMNQSLNISNTDKTITLVDKKKHRKLKLFNGKINEPPKEIDIKDISNLVVRIHVSQNNHQSRKEILKGQIIYFSDGKRIKSSMLKSDYTVKNVEFSFQDSNLKNYDSFRIILNFNDAEFKDNFKINYAYYEVTY